MSYSMLLFAQITQGVRDAGYVKIESGEKFIEQEEKKEIVQENNEKENLLIDLIRQSQDGDTRAMGLIYEKYKTPIYNLAYRYTYNSAVAEDLLQEIFLKVFTHIQDVDKKEFFEGWLYRVAVNTCLSFVRSRKAYEVKSVSLDSVESKINNQKFSHSEKMIHKSIDDAIQSLPIRLRSVFLLFDVQGFTHEEVAGILGCSVGTSKSQLFKARTKIRKHLKDKKIL